MTDMKIDFILNVPANSIKLMLSYDGAQSEQWFECPILKSQWTDGLNFRMTAAIRKAERQFSHETARRVRASKAVYAQAREWLRVQRLAADS